MQTFSSSDRKRGHAALLDALGGPKAVAEMIAQRVGSRLTPQCCSMWKARGVPWRYRMVIAEEAKARGITVPDGFLEGVR